MIGSIIFMFFITIVFWFFFKRNAVVLILALFFAMLQFSGSVLVGMGLKKDFSIEWLFLSPKDPNFLSGVWPSVYSWLLTSGLIFLFLICVRKYRECAVHGKVQKKRTSLLMLVCLLMSFLGVLALSSSKWVVNNFGGAGIQEIIYTISQPIAGTDLTQVISFVQESLMPSVFFSLLIVYLLMVVKLQSFSRSSLSGKDGLCTHKKRMVILSLTASFTMLFVGCTIGVSEFGYSEVKAYFFEKSKVFDEYYADPNEVNVVFPTRKRNLIYIYVESLEASYLSKTEGGALTENLMPSLTELIESGEALNFSNTEKIGGAKTAPGIGFTVGGMVGATAGVPLNVVGNLSANSYGETANFLPGVRSLGEELEQQGYRQMLMIGSDAAFGGRDKYFSQHGNYEIRDYEYAKKHGWIPEDYHVWWGYEDEKLFGFAKDSLTELSEESEPFNFTMLTADTHFPDGLVTAETPDTYDNQYYNVISNTDRQLGGFIAWLKGQDFYEDTTVIISGDHLTMDTKFAESIADNYDRTVFNLVLNSPIEATDSHYRDFTTMDMYPTTLAALGVEIDGQRLGLGTNLFSAKKTVSEEIGYEEFCNELTKRSVFYQEKILQGTDVAVKQNISEE